MTRFSGTRHGIGCPCSFVGVVRQANPAEIKTSASDEWIRDVKRSGLSSCQEKPLVSKSLPVPQTDTGRQVEDTKACEITIVKELGNLTP